MTLPRKDFSGQTATITLTELRAEPGEVIDRVRYGMKVNITKNGRIVAVIVPAPTVINSDGTWSGEKPLMMGVKL